MDSEISLSSKMTTDHRKKILDERANKLAIVNRVEFGQSEKREFLSFSSGGEHYLLSSEYVVEVVRYKEVTMLPGVDRKLAGIFSFRGSILGAYDGEKLLNGKNGEKVANHSIIVCALGSVQFAISCEEITGIQYRSLSDLLENSSDELLPSIIKGVFDDSARCIDFEKLVKDESLKIL
ncbi:MAG: chemotaxis protein CheW [Ignavibacteriales bacterium]|nr:chemotaxis protein CheW [Ignavibacteriales bacterium]